MITLDLSILNQKGTPMFNSDIFANRPAAGIAGRIFISTDTLAIFRDTGSTWDVFGGGGGGTIAGTIAAQQIAFGTALNTIGGSSNFLWNTASNRLSINGSSSATFTMWGGDMFMQSQQIIASGTALGSYAGAVYNSIRLYDTATGQMSFNLYNNTWNIRTNANLIVDQQTILGATSNTGERLQVTGTSRLNGNLDCRGNAALNTGGYTTLSFPNNNYFAHDAVGTNNQLVFFGSNVLKIAFGGSNGMTINPTAQNSLNTDGELSVANRRLNNAQIYNALVGPSITNNTAISATYNATGAISLDALNGLNGSQVFGVRIAHTFSAVTTNQNTSFTGFNFSSTINQSAAGITAITRGIDINPTLTLAVDFRGIEWRNNTGWGLYGSGTAPSYFNGNVQIGNTTAISNLYKLQLTGRQYILHTSTYSGAGVQSFVTSKNVTINQTISGGNGLNNQINTGLNIFSSTQTIPETTTYATIFNYNEYQFSSAGITLFASQSAGGIRSVSQLTTQNVFGGSFNGTMSHVSGIQINGFYNPVSGINPTITNAYQLLINDTGEFGHPFTFTNRWGIYQKGINDRNYLEGNLLLNSTTDTGQILQVNGAIRVNGQASVSAGGNSGNHLIINVDGTQYKIALLNP